MLQSPSCPGSFLLWKGSPAKGKSLRAALEACLFQIHREQAAGAGCGFAEIRAILVQTGYVLLIGRINEPGCSSIAIRNNTTTISVPFLCRVLKWLISPFGISCNGGFVKYRMVNCSVYALLFI